MEKDNFEDVGGDGRLMKWIFNKRDEGGVDCSGSAYGQVAGFCERGYETSVFTKCGEFLE
jgi:hypothetical protein